MSKVRETVVNALLAENVETVFCLMGDSVQNLMGDLAARPDVRMVHGRHESAVVGMADGYARFSGRVGCAVVTAGPGLTNTATALMVARAHRSPVLLLAGDMPVGGPTRPADEWDQQAFGTLTAGMGGRVEKPADLPGHLSSALRALADHRPYVLSLPTDVQESAYDIPGDPEVPASVAPVPVPAAGIREAADVLAGARAVGIVAGRGALVAGAGRVLRDLADRLGAVLSTTLPAHGLFAGHPADVGMVGGLGSGLANRALELCDVVLAVGTSLGPMVRSGLPEHARLLVVDTAPAPTTGRSESGPWIRADAAAAVRTLNRLLSNSPVRDLDRTVEKLLRNPVPADPSRWQDTAVTVDPRHALSEMADSLPAGSGVVLGGGHAALNGCQILRASSPAAWTCVSTDFGAIGQALPVAIGCSLARPEYRTYHITGDGDLMMSLAELDTAVRYNVPLTVVILNDQGFAQERVTLRHRGLPVALADHPSPDFAAVARAMGARGCRIEGPGQLDLLKEALAWRSGPVVIDVRINAGYFNPVAVELSRMYTRSDRGD